MGLLFALALIILFLRDFYELATSTGEAAVAWALGTILGIGNDAWCLPATTRVSATRVRGQVPEQAARV